MSRLFVRTAAVTFCVALAGCASTETPNAAPATPVADATAPNADASASSSLAVNLDTQIRQAQILRSQGDYEGASHALSQLMLVAPDDPRVVGEYGKVLAQRGRSADAIAFLQRATQLQPNDWTLYSALGVAYDQVDDRAHARAAYDHALALKPGEPVVLNNYAVSRMLAGDYDGAQKLLAQAAPGAASNPKIAANMQAVADMRSSSTPSAPTIATAPKPAPAHFAAATPKPYVVKPLPPGTVMQRVPLDPQAGPVASATHAPRKLATAAPAAATPAPAPAKKAADAKAAATSQPSLRTAAD